MPRLTREERHQREQNREDNERFLQELTDRRAEILRRLAVEPHPIQDELAEVDRWIEIVNRGLERN